MIPILLDFNLVLKRVLEEEKTWAHSLAELEHAIRRFEDLDQPAYERWLRTELGPSLQTIEELYAHVQERRLFAKRVMEIAEEYGIHPREALYVVLEARDLAARQREEAENARQNRDPNEEPRKPKTSGWSAEEVKARKKAKLEAKREQRKQAKAESKAAQFAESPYQEAPIDKNKVQLVSLYRTLVRKLHPDSSEVIKSIAASRLQAVWLEVQDAYQKQSVERLLGIAAWLEKNTLGEENFTLSTATLTIGERYDRIKMIKRSHVKLEKRILQLSEHAAWDFENLKGSERKKLRQQAAREVSEELGRVQEILAELGDFIDSIGPPRPPKGKRG